MNMQELYKKASDHLLGGKRNTILCVYEGKCFLAKEVSLFSGRGGKSVSFEGDHEEKLRLSDSIDELSEDGSTVTYRYGHLEHEQGEIIFITK